MKRTIERWRFRPARSNGKAAACWAQQTIIFQRGPDSPFALY